jgi:hypothetical protein
MQLESSKHFIPNRFISQTIPLGIDKLQRDKGQTFDNLTSYTSRIVPIRRRDPLRPISPLCHQVFFPKRAMRGATIGEEGFRSRWPSVKKDDRQLEQKTEQLTSGLNGLITRRTPEQWNFSGTCLSMGSRDLAGRKITLVHSKRLNTCQSCRR